MIQTALLRLGKNLSGACFLDYDMINEDYARKYCGEDISLIENYAEAVADDTHTWDCHHRAEILPCGRYTKAQLEKHGLYWNVPASQLIFLTHGEHMRMHNEGKHYSEETLAKMRASAKIALNKPETRAKMSAAITGKKHSSKTRAKMSASHKGKTHSTEARAKISAACKGKTFSAEHRAKISEAAKMREAAKRRHKQ